MRDFSKNEISVPQEKTRLVGNLWVIKIASSAESVGKKVRHCPFHLVWLFCVNDQPFGGRAMVVKTVLNQLLRFKSFLLGHVVFEKHEGKDAVIVVISPRKGGRPVCQECSRKGPGYDLKTVRPPQYAPDRLQGLFPLCATPCELSSPRDPCRRAG